MKNAPSEYENFERTVRELLKVPHGEIKAKLDAEKEAKRVAKKSKATHRRGA